VAEIKGYRYNTFLRLTVYIGGCWVCMLWGQAWICPYWKTSSPPRALDGTRTRRRPSLMDSIAMARDNIGTERTLWWWLLLLLLLLLFFLCYNKRQHKRLLCHHLSKVYPDTDWHDHDIRQHTYTGLRCYCHTFRLGFRVLFGFQRLQLIASNTGLQHIHYLC